MELIGLIAVVYLTILEIGIGTLIVGFCFLMWNVNKIIKKINK